MSTAVMVPPPNSSSLLRRVPRLTGGARQLLTAVNLHFAGVAALVVLDLYLVLHLLFVWQALSNSGPDAIAQQRTMLRAAQIAAQPLQGIDQKIVDATQQADTFSAQRLPYAYSAVAAELGNVSKREGVRLAHVNYGQAAVLSGAYALTEVRMDASISGEYRSVVGMINSLERDRMFFAITGITLTGQESGQVNLRLRLMTYLRAPNPDEVSAEPPIEAPATGEAAGPGGAQ